MTSFSLGLPGLDLGSQASGGGAPAIPAPTAVATVNSTSNLLANQIIQRDTLTGGGQGKGQGSVPLSFSAVTQAGTIHARCSSGGATRGDLQAEWAAATIASTGAQTVSITGVDAGLRWFYLDILDSSGTWQNGTVLIGMGDLTLVSGQSLGVYFIFNNDTAWSNAAVKAANGGADLSLDPNLQYTRIFATCETYSAATVTGVSWEQPGASHYLSSGGAKYLTTLAAQLGCVQGIAANVSSGSYQSFWQAAPTGTGNNGYQQLVRVINATGGKYRFQIWWQGHADSESSVPAAHYANDMDLREFGTNGLSTLNTYPRANVIRLVNTIPNINIGPYYYGPMRNANAIRKGAKDWCAAKNNGVNTNGIYVEMPGLNLAFDPHPGTIGCIEAAKCFSRAAMSDNSGPALVSAARDPALPNDLILTFSQQSGADFQLSGNWWTRVAVYIAGSTQNYIVPTAGSKISSTQLRVTLTAPTGGTWAVGDSFDVYMGAPWDGDRSSDPSGNMIRDDRTDTIDSTNGRVFQTNQVAVNAAQISAGATTATANYPITYKAPSSINDVVMTTPTYDTVEHLTGFGLPLIGGTGATRNNQVAGNGHGMVAFGVGITYFARFRAPNAAPAANRYIFKVAGAGLILNNAMKLLGTGDNLSGAVTSGALTAGKVYWAAVSISPSGAVKLYWFNCTDAAQSVQLVSGGTTNKNYSIGNGPYTVSVAGTSDFFNGTTGGSIMEVGAYDVDTIYTGAAGSFTPPSSPLVGNESHLIFYDRTIAANDTAGVQADAVKAF